MLVVHDTISISGSENEDTISPNTSDEDWVLRKALESMAESGKASTKPSEADRTKDAGITKKTNAREVVITIGEHNDSDEKRVFELVDDNPEFPGGNKALMEWLSKNLNYPAKAQRNNVQGRVLVQFVVEMDGSIAESRILRSVDPDLDAEALRVVNAMPKWHPGRHRGKHVRVRFTLPITFRME